MACEATGLASLLRRNQNLPLSTRTPPVPPSTHCLPRQSILNNSPGGVSASLLPPPPIHHAARLASSPADGDLRGRRHQAHPARAAAVLHQAGRVREEPQAQRPARRAGIQPGGDLRLEGGARQRTEPAADRVQLPQHLHPLGHEAGGAHRALQDLQGVQQAHPGLHGPLWPRHRRGAREHCDQLRLPRPERPVPASRGPRGPLRHQGASHQLCLQPHGRGGAGQGAEPLRGQHRRAA
mmetsp:Transcript_21625/g.37102  ORF Transcript_21625/g.37102 Transcript_21625/m.37102 type:complete len:238 (+) Transcript_21625:1396-2109(+)